MWFKNLNIYRLTKEFNPSIESLEKALQEFKFQPCGSQDISKFGFNSPYGRKSDVLVHSAEGNFLISVMKEEKILPSSVVNEAVQEKIDEILDAEGRKVTKKERDAIKDDVTTSLLPRAFSKKTTLKAVYIKQLGCIIIDTNSYAKAEELLALLRKALGSLPILPIAFKSSISAVMSDWIKTGEQPEGLDAQFEATLQSPESNSGRIMVKDYDLTDDKVSSHLDDGKEICSLAILFGQSISFTMDITGRLSKVKFTDEFRASNDDVGNEDPLARFDADFTLMTGETTKLIECITAAFGGIELTI